MRKNIRKRRNERAVMNRDGKKEGKKEMKLKRQSIEAKLDGQERNNSI